MTDALIHRGPDGAGLYPGKHAVLGNRRLSIIDLSESGRQPVPNEDETVWVTFNGEIYNYQGIRQELVDLGHRFRSHTDTEILVHGYEQWGLTELLKRVRGMFGFALYDLRSSPHRLFVVRDRLGIKPVYYSSDGRRLLFSSEIQSLRKSGAVGSQDDTDAYLAFLMFGSVPAPMTTLTDVRVLPPGHYLDVTVDGMQIRQYYDLAELFCVAGRRPSDGCTHEEKLLRIRSVLEETVGQHLISDAPLGIFLSGGIDSSALVALASQQRQKLVTLGVVFGEKGYSEEPFQDAVVRKFGTEHRRIPVSLRDFHDELEKFCETMDQPTVDGFNTYFVARAARQVGLKAVMSGLGGDEVFCGYPTLRRAGSIHRLHSLIGPLRSPVVSVASQFAQYSKLAYLKRKGALPFYLVQRGLFTPQQASALLEVDEARAWNLLESLEPARSPENPVELQQFLEARHYLVEQLLKDTDVFAMTHSVEVRVPFLDHRLMEEVLDTPVEWRLSREWPKPLLTRPLQDLLPREVVFRRKQGFTLPMEAWLRASNAIFKNPGTRLSPAFYKKAWDSFMAGSLHWSRPWALIVMARTADL